MYLFSDIYKSPPFFLNIYFFCEFYHQQQQLKENKNLISEFIKKDKDVYEDFKDFFEYYFYLILFFFFLDLPQCFIIHPTRHGVKEIKKKGREIHRDLKKEEENRRDNKNPKESRYNKKFSRNLVKHTHMREIFLYPF